MLRRAEKAQFSFSPNWLTGKGWLVFHLGARSEYRIRKMRRDDYAQLMQSQAKSPWRVGRIDQRTYWLFRGKFYWDNDNLGREAIYALLETRQRREAQRVELAQQTVAISARFRQASRRKGIPDDVKQYVWTRDGGRCRNCWGNTEIQFDHVIPISLGGSNEPENLQLLCGPCNRRKGASITLR